MLPQFTTIKNQQIKGAVEASDGKTSTTKKDDSNGILSKGSEVIGEGWKNILDAVEKAITATSVGIISQKKKKKDEDVCECEAQVRAFIRMIRVGEGTGELIKSSKYNTTTKKNEIVYVPHDFEKGYTTAFG